MDRESFLTKIEEYLISVGFDKIEDTFISKRQVQQPGQTMIINGKRMMNPGQVIDVKFEVLLVGPGSMLNKNGECERKFDVIEFHIIQNGEYMVDYSNSFNWDEFGIFKMYCEKIFNI